MDRRLPGDIYDAFKQHNTFEKSVAKHTFEKSVAKHTFEKSVAKHTTLLGKV